MKKAKLPAIAFAASAFSIGSENAGFSRWYSMEKCKVIDKDGKGLIKVYKSEYATSKHSYTSHGLGDP